MSLEFGNQDTDTLNWRGFYKPAFFIFSELLSSNSNNIQIVFGILYKAVSSHTAECVY